MSLLLTTKLSGVYNTLRKQCCAVKHHTKYLFGSDCCKNKCSDPSTQTMDELSLALMSRQLAPPLTEGKHKGQAGRIGVFGGSLEYTGAPYFSAITAMKVGADLVHVFCSKEAAPVIKSYSPELIVHPLLDAEDAVNKIEPWLDRLHVLLIGPGLGRDPSIFEVIIKIIGIARTQLKPLVIDADGLFLITEQKDLLKDFPSPGAILTPNAMEYARLFGLSSPEAAETSNPSQLIGNWGNNVTILRKGAEDIIIDYEKTIKLSGGGSGRRCGGQGDLLGGALSVFYAWALQHKLDVDVTHDDRAMLACYSACKLVRELNARAFKKLGRSMTASDMIHEIHPVFDEYFELK